MTPAALAELEAAAREATAGPWTYGADPGSECPECGERDEQDWLIQRADGTEFDPWSHLGRRSKSGAMTDEDGERLANWLPCSGNESGCVHWGEFE